MIYIYKKDLALNNLQSLISYENKSNQIKSNVHLLFCKPYSKNAIINTFFSLVNWRYEGARGVMVIVVGHGHGVTSSNPRRD